MAVVRKKQDDKYLKALRELVTSGGSGGGAGNRQCFDCGQKGPTYVNMTIGSFVCTRCSGVLRGLTPPHRVKSISMATFTQEEIDFLKTHGNDLCAKTWLGLWDPKRAVHQDHREIMIDKYERKRYFLEPASPLKSLTNAASLKSNSQQTAASSSIQINNNNNNNSNNTNGNSAQQPLTNGYAGHNNHKQNGAAIDNSFQNIQLTPPTSQRTTANGLHKSSSTAISRPQQQNGYNHHQHHHQDAFMVNNNNNNNNSCLLNGLSSLNGGVGLNVGSAASTGALSDTSSCTSNGFGPDADFVADFGSANIFDATSASSVGSPAVSSASSVASSNGYAKIQPIRAAHHQFMNGGGNANSKQQLLPLQNGGTTSSASTCNNGNAENFADFDRHSPIFIAAENYQFIRKKNIKKKTTTNKYQQQQEQRQQQQQTNANIETTNFFANLRQATSEIVATASTSSNSSNSNKNHNASKMPTTRSAADIIFSESTSNFNDPFDDFNAIVVGNNNNNNNNNSGINNMQRFAATFENDFDEMYTKMQTPTPQPPPQSPAPKFTPLAMAAHATAMAVLGSNCHFNSNIGSSNSAGTLNFSEHRTPFANEQWDVWQDSTLDSSTTTTKTTTTTSTLSSPANFANNNNKYNSMTTAAADAWPASNSNSINNRYVAAAETTNNAYTILGGNNPSASSSLSHLTAAAAAAAPNPNPAPLINSPAAPTSSSSSSSHPMPNGIGKNASATASTNAFNNNKLTPAEDRYAALKDLDEQLRESKAVAAAAASIVATSVVDSFGNPNHNNNGQHPSNAGNVNPFKSQQQQQQQQVNPFQVTNNAQQQQQQQQQQNLYGQMTVIPSGIATNGFAGAHQTSQPTPTQQQHHHHQQQQQQQQAFFNYSNGFTATTGGANATLFPSAVGGPNGCGFGFGTMQQQIAATGGGMGMGGGAFNNPFAANSNNPFL